MCDPRKQRAPWGGCLAWGEEGREEKDRRERSKDRGPVVVLSPTLGESLEERRLGCQPAKRRTPIVPVIHYPQDDTAMSALFTPISLQPLSVPAPETKIGMVALHHPGASPESFP